MSFRDLELEVSLLEDSSSTLVIVRSSRLSIILLSSTSNLICSQVITFYSLVRSLLGIA
jgi:hypothetical protein